MSPAAAHARDSARLSLCSSQAGTDHPDRALATICAATVGAPLGQATVRRCQAGHRPDQLVRAYAEGGVRLLEPAARLAQLIVFQVHPGECDERRGVGVRAGRPLLVGRARPRSPGRPAVAARPSRPRKASTSARCPRQSARSSSSPGRGRGGHPDSRTRAASSRWPDHSSTAPRPDSTRARISGCRASLSPGTLLTSASARAAAAAAAARSPVRREAARRIIAAASRARGLLIGGKTLEDAFGGIQRGGATIHAGQRTTRPRRRPGAAAARSRLGRAACPRTRRPGTGCPAAR